MKNNEKILKGLFIVIIALSIVIGYAAIIMGIREGQIYFIFLLSLIPLIVAGLLVHHKLTVYRILNELKKSWGKKQDKKRSFNEIQSLFRRIEHEEASRFMIDDQTWEDLNMDLIFSVLDRTLTTPGEQVLYNMMRMPVFEKEILGKRKETIKLFEENETVREEIYNWLYRLGRQKDSYVTSLMWGNMPPMTKFAPLFSLMALIGLISVALIPFLGVRILIIGALPLFGINFLINYKVKKKILAELTSLRYLGSIINTADKISKSSTDSLKEYSEALLRVVSVCRIIAKKSSMLMPYQGGDYIGAFYEYINVFFLIEVRSFYAVLSYIKKYRKELREMYFILGEIDALLSTASYRTGLKSYVEPELSWEGAALYAKNIRHPLLEEPVPNSIDINREGIIITGCNMSGKSTFLRTLGVNALFAQTICTCLASSYSGSYLRVMTSISRGDNLVGGKSYYLAEAESLLRIIKACGDNTPCLCILDEMFRGTNSIERINASAEILKYLVSHNCLAVIATHDYELTEMLGDLYKCYYFNECIEENGISFDYKIKHGVSMTRNAVKLMDYLGYPKEIINGTNKRVAEFV